MNKARKPVSTKEKPGLGIKQEFKVSLEAENVFLILLRRSWSLYQESSPPTQKGPGPHLSLSLHFLQFLTLYEVLYKACSILLCQPVNISDSYLNLI